MKNLSLLFIVFLFLHLTTFAQWTQKADIPTARSWVESCTLDGKIYVIGGTESTSANGPSVGTMEVYDPAFDSWDTTKAPMHTSRVEFVACAVNGKIYAIGGAGNHGASPFGFVEEYDPLTNTWDNTTKEPMPTPRKGAAYGVIDNKIYVAGGSASSNWVASNKLEIYDPLTDTWDITKAPMPIAMYQPQGAVINDTFYVIGGLLGYSPWTGQKTTQIYDPATDIWSLGADLDSGRVGHTTNGVAGYIYAILGDGQPPRVRSVEEYNPNTDSWNVIVDSLPFMKICHTASVFENKIYLFSGSTTSLPNLTPSSAVYSFAPPPTTPTLISPTDSVNATEFEFIWTASYPEIDWYWFEIDTTDQFSTSIIDTLITDTTYIYSDLENHKDYWWRIKAHNSLGWGEFSEVATFTVNIVSVEEDNQLPVVFSMEQNYPNPFNPNTKIKYSIPDLSFVTLRIYDVLGNEITTLVNEEKPVGSYEVEFDATSLSSGVYFYRMKAGSLVETKKMVLMK